jgi:hypothetical protein
MRDARRSTNAGVRALAVWGARRRRRTTPYAVSDSKRGCAARSPLLTSSSAASVAAVCHQAMAEQGVSSRVGPVLPVSGGEGGLSDREALLSRHRGGTRCRPEGLV